MTCHLFVQYIHAIAFDRIPIAWAALCNVFNQNRVLNVDSYIVHAHFYYIASTQYTIEPSTNSGNCW